VRHRGAPTCVIAVTVKGYGLGEAGEDEHHPPAEKT
jgi:pyruvate dehydrogenase complex dehydrogenase (E1) component